MTDRIIRGFHWPMGFEGCVLENESAAEHTTFKIGGPFEIYIKPTPAFFVKSCEGISFAARQVRSVFTLGGGSNLLVGDEGVDGITLDVSDFSGLERVEKEEDGAVTAIFRAGTPTASAVEWAVNEGLTGLEEFAGLPGSLGGAVWMNARCYEKDIAEVASSITYLDTDTLETKMFESRAGFAYKKSPFQKMNAVILHVPLLLKKGDKARIAEDAQKYLAARVDKGHFRYPSAGSVWKNNRAFGKSTGQLVEEAGLRGAKEGGAQVAPWHGNFIVNTGGATARDVVTLMERVENAVLAKWGYRLEREVLTVGRF